MFESPDLSRQSTHFFSTGVVHVKVCGPTLIRKGEEHDTTMK